jgi:hypothetical protein
MDRPTVAVIAAKTDGEHHRQHSQTHRSNANDHPLVTSRCNHAANPARTPPLLDEPPNNNHQIDRRQDNHSQKAEGAFQGLHFLLPRLTHIINTTLHRTALKTTGDCHVHSGDSARDRYLAPQCRPAEGRRHRPKPTVVVSIKISRLVRSTTRPADCEQYGNLLNRINLICPVQSSLQKHSASHLTQISSRTLAVSLPRGAYRDRHGRGAGCGGRGGVLRAT